MRTSIAGVTFLLVGAGAVSVAALDDDGIHIALNGSDTLHDVTDDVMTACAGQFTDWASVKPTYEGGGSGVGAKNQQEGKQKIGPASRAYNTGEVCGPFGTDASSRGAARGKAESLLVGIDGIALVADITTSSCSSAGVANGFGIGTAFDVTDDGTPLPTGTQTLPCPGCVGGKYTFVDSFDALKVLYFGLHNDNTGTTHPGTYNCASPVRKTLIKQWKNLFKTDCSTGDGTCAGGLTHAWRRSDLAGTTDAFVSILNPPKRGGAGTNVGIGTPPGVNAAAPKINAFCNSLDANTTPDVSIPGTFGGASDFQDKDPIRTKCAPTATQADDSVCGLGDGLTDFQGDLGVVLPILIPDATSALPSDNYPTIPCLTSCTLVAPIAGSLMPNGYRCPNGAPPAAGTCFVPYGGSSSAPDPRCIASNLNKCVGASGSPDGRVFNQSVVVLASQIPAAKRGGANYQFALDSQDRILDHTYFRMHAYHAGKNGTADASVGRTGLCKENDDTSQIGCLVNSDPCSVGYAGREAAKYYPGLVVGGTLTPQPAPLKAMALKNIPPFAPTGDADAFLKNLLTGSGTIYPMARRLYVTTVYGFGELQNGEKELAACFAKDSILTTIMTKHGFVPTTGGVKCIDYPETKTDTSTPAPNAPGGLNTDFFPGCALTGNTDACTTVGTAPGICGDGVVSTSFGESCDPPTSPATGASGSCDANCKLIP
jgi:hypothetical protein